jgi:hypothetical protein
MEAKYYIGTRPQANGYHYIHREDCPLLPSTGERIYLGTFLSPGGAAVEGKKYFSNPDFCSFCLKEYYKEIRNHMPAGSGKNWDHISSIAVIPSWESPLACGVN